MDQYVRDARINMIYEGTNTIQSLDLLGRKVLLDNGVKLAKFVGIVKRFVEDAGATEGMAEFTGPLALLAGEVEQLTMDLGMKAMQDADEVGAAAADYLRIVGHLAYGYFWARMAKIALDQPSSDVSFYTAKLATARFYFSRLFPETESLVKSARSGAHNLLALEAAQF